jgi:cobalt-zinc-cadmium efflux system protein
MSHGHDHAAPAAEDSNKGRLLLVVSITAAVFVAEVAGAWCTGSLALLADAGHMLTDIAGLLLALLAANLVTKPVTSGRTWGFRRAETLAAGRQALLLLAVGGCAFIEAIRRLFDPPRWPRSGCWSSGSSV